MQPSIDRSLILTVIPDDSCPARPGTPSIGHGRRSAQVGGRRCETLSGQSSTIRREGWEPQIGRAIAAAMPAARMSGRWLARAVACGMVGWLISCGWLAAMPLKESGPWEFVWASAGRDDTTLRSESSDAWRIQRLEGGQLEVWWGSQLVTGLRHVDLKKPVLYPVFGPGGQSMVRHYPVLKGIAGEATDHPHHKSIWFAHGNVNGHSYWDEKATIRLIGEPQLEPDQRAFRYRAQWLATGSADTEVATEATRISFGQCDPQAAPWEGGWWVQYQAQIEASVGDLTFGDTKEGFFAMRMHPNLRLTNDPRAGVTTANGRALNSAGQRDGALWGQPAEWVAYGGTIGEQPVTIVMMDHPKNLRHPTTWHARDYGLVAANPFGLHDFRKSPPGTGDFTLSRGQTLEFCYRIVFLPTLLDEEAIRAAFREFAASPNGWQD